MIGSKRAAGTAHIRLPHPDSDLVGLDEYSAEVLPQDKAAKVKEVEARGVLVAMTATA